ncbi:MAG: LysR family transcriptional regulator [Alphaproteobacteria bacterium]|nr:LysR family transcriptional regulator [Alphaproteobacteria bacterium]
MRHLPPFQPLVTFEAVVRLGGFARAAAELGLTQSAVSHQIRRLEHAMGQRLIDRTPPLQPTAAGAALLPELIAALDLLARLPAVARGGDAPLRLAASAAVATWWLAPRLQRFAAGTAPAARIELLPATSWSELTGVEAELRLLWLPSAEARASSTQRLLPPEMVFPVAAPALLAQAGGNLAALPLVWKATPDAPLAVEWDWRTWLPTVAQRAGGLSFRDLGAAQAAAVAGAGAVLSRSLLVADPLADGRLQRVLPASEMRPCSKRLVLSWSPALIGDARTRRLSDWLEAEASVSLAGLR